MPKILIIDDDRLLCQTLIKMVKRMGHEAKCAHTLSDGLEQARAEPFDIVLLDVRMPDGNGLELLPRLRATPADPEVIIITGLGDANGADLAIRSGAWDYIQKASSLKEMMLPLTRALQYRQKKNAPAPHRLLKREKIIGDSPALNACLELLAAATGSEASVLLTGETGTGKELFASAIHQNSPRAAGNFVTVDCAALPENLVESLLFGHQRGAFTGAHQTQSGLVKQADGGTLFLDEIGELPPATQKSFLRVLQERRFRPVGAAREVESDFRLVAATNRDLERMVRDGTFRDDLLYRLRACVIELPPLRARRQDINQLAFHYLELFCKRYRLKPKGLAPDFLEILTDYAWPGNVRELVQTIERALSAAREEPTLFAGHLPQNIRIAAAQSRLDPAQPVAGDGQGAPAPRETAAASAAPDSGALPAFREYRDARLAEIEREYLGKLMDASDGNVKSACETAGLGRARLYALLKKHGITKNRC